MRRVKSLMKEAQSVVKALDTSEIELSQEEKDVLNEFAELVKFDLDTIKINQPKPITEEERLLDEFKKNKYEEVLAKMSSLGEKYNRD